MFGEQLVSQLLPGLTLEIHTEATDMWIKEHRGNTPSLDRYFYETPMVRHLLPTRWGSPVVE
jgi:hypothetical protein